MAEGVSETAASRSQASLPGVAIHPFAAPRNGQLQETPELQQQTSLDIASSLPLEDLLHYAGGNRRPDGTGKPVAGAEDLYRAAARSYLRNSGLTLRRLRVCCSVMPVSSRARLVCRPLATIWAKRRPWLVSLRSALLAPVRYHRTMILEAEVHQHADMIGGEHPLRPGPRPRAYGG